MILVYFIIIIAVLMIGTVIFLSTLNFCLKKPNKAIIFYILLLYLFTFIGNDRVRLYGMGQLFSFIPPMQFYQFEWGKDVNSRQARIFKDLVGLYWYSIMPLLLLGFIKFIKAKDYFYPLCFLLVIFAMGLSGWVDPRIRLMAIKKWTPKTEQCVSVNSA